MSDIVWVVRIERVDYDTRARVSHVVEIPQRMVDVSKGVTLEQVVVGAASQSLNAIIHTMPPEK